MPRHSSGRQLANEQTMEKWWATFPPSAPLNATVKRQEFIKLNTVLLKQGYDHADIDLAIEYASMKGRRYKTIASIAFIIEESKLYWAKMRQLEQERVTVQMDVSDVTMPMVEPKQRTIGWLGVSDFEEVE